jgi:hypothetical protein
MPGRLGRRRAVSRLLHHDLDQTAGDWVQQSSWRYAASTHWIARRTPASEALAVKGSFVVDVPRALATRDHVHGPQPSGHWPRPTGERQRPAARRATGDRPGAPCGPCRSCPASRTPCLLLHRHVWTSVISTDRASDAGSRYLGGGLDVAPGRPTARAGGAVNEGQQRSLTLRFSRSRLWLPRTSTPVPALAPPSG